MVAFESGKVLHIPMGQLTHGLWACLWLSRKDVIAQAEKLASPAKAQRSCTESGGCCPGQVSPHPEATANLGHWPDDVLPMPAKKLWRAKLNLFGIKGCPFRSGALADEICVRNLTRRMG
jgi:hypothetical protein